MTRVFAALLILLLSPFPAAAQDNFWVQIEARQTLTSAIERAREYARRLDAVNGFYLGSGYYGILIGPYSEAGAEVALDRFLARGEIPYDSFIKDGTALKQQFWPIGAGALAGAAALPEPGAPAPLPTPPETPDETPAQARTSEAQLTREGREDLQRALQWAGFYDAAIDGSFGRGTRSAMQAWQAANNQEATGILTTRQRAMLFDQYNSILDQLDLRVVEDLASGIRMKVPAGVVAFSDYQPPFVRFGPTGDVQAQVLFISQQGDAGRMLGLYEIMQVLDIVPPEGPRSIRTDGFEIEGIGDGLHSYTTVTLRDGVIKGFTLVWPEGDAQRRTRLLEEMLASFEWLDGVLDPAIVPAGEDQRIDMVSGLSIRQPRLSRSGFFVSADGVVVTTPEAVQACDRITLDRENDAEVFYEDPELGIALLRPTQPLVPIDVAGFEVAVPRLRDQVAVAGYPFNGVLNAPTLTFGQVIDIRSLKGDDRVKRLAILPQDGDAGGPVFNENGAVLGMLLPRVGEDAQVLPAEVNFSLDAAQIVAALGEQGITARLSDERAPISPVTLTRKAADVTVLVNCW